ncbi:hypothetical protein IJH02_03630 [Candidatus Saccharibacteria bacterium]|nr:hypothetical protein [Candidatus Saccharibacteria bacterium]
MTEKTEGLYGENPTTKAQSIRFILTTVLVAVVILGIAVWGIIYAVSGEKKVEAAPEEIVAQTEQTAQTDQTDQTDQTSDVIEVTNLNEESATSAATTETAAATTATAATTAQNNIPKTGPESVLPVALLAGAFVTFIGSLKLAKNKA